MTALTVKQDLGLTISQDWNTMKEQAGMLVKSGFLPPALNTAEKVIAVALKGRELGIGMMEAISQINIIQGKPTLSAQLMLALATRTGQLESFECPSTKDGAIARCKRKGWPMAEVRFGPSEARALGLDAKDNYKKQPETMYVWRATSAVLRKTFPDALSGLYTPEELGADVEVNEDGSLTVQAQVVPTIAMPKAKEASPVEASASAQGEPARKGITDTQRRKFHAVADAADLSDDDKKKFLKAVAGVESTKDLTQDQYSRLMEELDRALTPPETPDEPQL